ncbi:hypothetical protein SAMN05421819_4343 [Bryocella elongata]|uniref:Uncharacterized protein n=1 Tax=Bryocella elongata TaxID=863522 RepID=A0A1H6C906_9BACT|nr:hypothetical protein SAMN05421819_4343 [Bryocella elongata]
MRLQSYDVDREMYYPRSYAKRERKLERTQLR